jgi:hypothetical protein
MDPVSAGIIAGGGLLGGIFGSSSQKKANAANMDFAKNQVRYRVADAKAAGIHPLAALGMSAGSSPQQVGDTSMADAVANTTGQLGNLRANAKIDALNQELLKAQINSTNAQAHMYRSSAMENDFALLSAQASNIAKQSSIGTPVAGSNVNTWPVDPVPFKHTPSTAAKSGGVSIAPSLRTAMSLEEVMEQDPVAAMLELMRRAGVGFFHQSKELGDALGVTNKLGKDADKPISDRYYGQ